VPCSTRTANIDDIVHVARLNQAIQQLHVEIAPDIFRDGIAIDEYQEFWRDVLGDDTNIVLVAQEDSTIVGYLWAQVQVRPQSVFTYARQRLYVHHVGIDLSHQHIGLGSRLLAQAEAIAIERDLKTVIIDCLAANSVAQGFYTKGGYMPLNVAFAKIIAAE